MRYRFDGFELDTGQFALRSAGTPVHVEPLVFDLLTFLVGRAGEVVSRDLMIEQVWSGRIVSEATISSCIKAARKALGDDGERQRYIRTVRGRGFQFVAAIESTPAHAPSSDVERPAAALSGPPRVAVLPLFPMTADPRLAVLGDAVAQEVILELSRLHWLFVIARGSTFKFRGQEVDMVQAGDLLGADYFVTGTIMQEGRRSIVAVELGRAADNAVLWAERYVTPTAELMHMRVRLAAEIAAALEPRIQQSEVTRSSRIATENLDAWAAYHRGLWHMYRFTRHDNATAAGLFGHALRLDPAFARAHAGKSFTHFQNAFLGFEADHAAERLAAQKCAEAAMAHDPLDPFVNLTTGRAAWLTGNLEASLPWIERSISLSPNYAFAIYNSALVGALLGDGAPSEERVTRAIALSPIDPLSYAMLATRALSYAVRLDYPKAAEWAERAVQAPNAHVQIRAIAAATQELCQDADRARGHVAAIRRMQPRFTKDDFLRSFPFRDAQVLRDFEAALARLGL